MDLNYIVLDKDARRCIINLLFTHTTFMQLVVGDRCIHSCPVGGRLAKAQQLISLKWPLPPPVNIQSHFVGLVFCFCFLSKDTMTTLHGVGFEPPTFLDKLLYFLNYSHPE